MRTGLRLGKAILGHAARGGRRACWGGTATATAIAFCVLGAAAHGQSDGHPNRPVLGPTPALHFPRVQLRTLSNGARVAVLEVHGLPIVEVDAMFDLPDAFDAPGKEGAAGLTEEMLKEGTTSRTADQIADATAELGNGVSPFGFMTVTANVDSSLALMGDELLRPAFRESALARLKATATADLTEARQHSGYFASRVLRNVLYGPGHPYARHATEASLAAVTRDDLVAFHQEYYRPKNVTFLVAGDITPAVAVAKLERVFGGNVWPDGGLAGRQAVPVPKGAGPTKVYLYDRPGSVQTTIVVAQLGPSRDTPDYYALELANTVLGGVSSSRLNLDLRERHGWTYGAHSSFSFRAVPELGVFSASAEVATAKTDSALVALLGDIGAFVGTKPVTDSEVAFAKREATMGLPLEFANLSKMAGAEGNLLEEHLPLDYYDRLVGQYNKVTVGELQDVVRRHLDPGSLAIIIVGDRKAIEARVRAANVAPVVVVNERAEPVGE